MERNKWETAIRCLEVALHPNTGNDEVIAAVNGFRRTADGRRLRDICAALAGAAPPMAPPRAAPPVDHSREIRELRRKLAEAESGHAAAAEQLREKTEETGRLRARLAAARDAAAAAERQLGEFRLTQTQLVDRLQRDNAELRRALDTARPVGATVMPSFGTALASALGRPEARSSTPDRAPPSRGAGIAWVA